MYTTLVHSLWECCTRVPPVGVCWPVFSRWVSQAPKVSTSNTKVARYAILEYAFRVSKPYLLSLTPLVYLISYLLLESCCLCILALNLSCANQFSSQVLLNTLVQRPCTTTFVVFSGKYLNLPEFFYLWLLVQVYLHITTLDQLFVWSCCHMWKQLCFPIVTLYISF